MARKKTKSQDFKTHPRQLRVPRKEEVFDVMAIDPSVRDIGVALGCVTRTEAWLVESCRLTFSRSEPDWIRRIHRATQFFSEYVEENEVSQVIVELPSVFRSAKGDAAANSQDIIKLAGCAFAYAAAAQLAGADVSMILVQSWKGTAPKEITQKRIQRAWNACPLDHNEADAVGIFDWYVRKLRRLRPTVGEWKRNVHHRISLD